MGQNYRIFDMPMYDEKLFFSNRNAWPCKIRKFIADKTAVSCPTYKCCFTLVKMFYNCKICLTTANMP